MKHISNTLTPMAFLGKRIKKKDPTAKCVFIGPCVSKRMEFLRESVREFIDCVLTYEELEALFDSKNIKLSELPESQIDSGSKYGRTFARSGGVRDAVIRGLSEIGYSDLACEMIAANGLEECKVIPKGAKRHAHQHFN